MLRQRSALGGVFGSPFPGLFQNEKAPASLQRRRAALELCARHVDLFLEFVELVLEAACLEPRLHLTERTRPLLNTVRTHARKLGNELGITSTEVAQDDLIG
jgi:hypothetical protein